jgi:glycosyltransferase involved in cell wall biosynthesis
MDKLTRLVRRPLQPESLENESDFRDLVARARQVRADVVWLGYGNISYPLMRYIKDHSSIPVVLDTDSVWSKFVQRGLPFASDETARKKIEKEGKLKEEEERWGTQLADVTTGVSEIDAGYYRGLTDDPGKVHLFSNVIDLNDYSPVSPPAGFNKPCMYLAGTFWPGSPMEDAARWMLEHVMPLLKRELPDIHFYVAGRASGKVLADVHDDNVTVAGELPSVLPYLTNASVAVVPLRFESGTRFKILEAGACRVPVVSTTLGAEGIPAVDGKDILIADTPEDFAMAVVAVIRDRRRAESLGQNLRELVAVKFSIQALAHEGENILEYLIARNNSSE